MRPRLFRPKSLRAIVAVYVAVILLALIGVRITSYFVMHDALSTEIDRRLATGAAAMADVVPGDIAKRIALAEANHDTADLRYAVFDSAGRHVAGTLRLDRPPRPGLSDFGEDARIPGVTHGRALCRRLADGSTLVVVSDNDEIAGFDTLLFRVQLVGLGLAALSVVGGAIGIRQMVRARMAMMRMTVDAVIAGHIGERVPLDGTHGEFDRQAAAFNHMLDKIEELIGNVKHAAQDVAHELKSPLARLRVQIAALSRRYAGAPIAPDLDDLLDQTNAILDLFNGLLRLWEIEAGHRRERFVTLDIAALAAEVGEALQPVAEEGGHSLIQHAMPAMQVRGDVALLRQLLVNLIENAIRHTPGGTRINIATARRGATVAVSVTDNGPGIPATEHETVIRRFGRLEASYHVPGQGLGLSLVDAIARLHGGRLILEDAHPGLRIVVEMPTALQPRS